MLPLKGVKHAVAVDYDPIEDQIYWTDEEVRDRSGWGWLVLLHWYIYYRLETPGDLG